MAEEEGSAPRPGDRDELSNNFATIAERSQEIVNDWLRCNGLSESWASSDPFNFTTLFLEVTTRMMAIPASVVSAQMSLWHDYFILWQNTTTRMLGYSDPHPDTSVGVPSSSAAGWHDSDIFTYVKQSYLLATRWLRHALAEGTGGDPTLRDGIDFYSRQFVAALSPSDFASTNPEVVRATIETRGENLINGLRNLLRALEPAIRLPVRTRRAEPFVVGRTVAATAGKVILRTPLMELIQYAPTTDQVVRPPLLFVPSWTGRFYVLDLCGSNSLVKWAVDQGHTVFVVSWAEAVGTSPGPCFEEYVVSGVIAALTAAAEAAGEAQINVAGHGLGGTLLACALAYLADHDSAPVASATFLTTLLDFSQPGELGMLIDDATLGLLEEAGETGGPDFAALARTTSLQRENDLIWSFVVNSYLLGSDAFPFDLLFWNWDAPRMLQALHGFYLHALYRQNRLAEPGGLRIGGRPLDLRNVRVPAYVLATREDHIAPWKSAYKATQLLGGANRFTLAASGHLAGVINPPGANRYCYWTNGKTPANPQEWQAGARAIEGSWWRDWDRWLKSLAGGDRIAARQAGNRRRQPLVDAPGSYARSAC